MVASTGSQENSPMSMCCGPASGIASLARSETLAPIGNRGMRRRVAKSFLLSLLVAGIFGMPSHAFAQTDCSNFNRADAIDFDYETGFWHDWDTGQDFFLNPLLSCPGGGNSWGYFDGWDEVRYADYFDDSSTYEGYAVTDMPTPPISCGSGYRPAMFVRTWDNWVANAWCEPIPQPPHTPQPLEIEAWWEVAGLFWDFAVGAGPQSHDYRQGSLQVYQMQSAPGVQSARSAWYQLNYYEIAYGGCHNLQEQRGFLAKFGLKGLIDAGGNATQQFVGGYIIDIIPDESGGGATFIAYNVTSMTSLLYDLGPSWSREVLPYGGDMTQTFTWHEQMCRQEN